MNETFDFKVVDGIIDELECKPSSIIAMLQSIQEHYRYLPKEVFPYLSEKVGISQAFYMFTVNDGFFYNIFTIG